MTDILSLFSQVSWRTTLVAAAYGVCKVVGGLYPPVIGVCDVIEPILVMLGFISATDSQRAQSIVRAVDHLFAKDNVDPATLAPIVAPKVS